MVIGLLRKEIFDVQIDKEFYEKFLNFFREEIEKIFGHDMALVSSENNFSYRGFFMLSYTFLPLNYNIIIENEFRAFGIMIEDSEGASSCLNRMAVFDNALDRQNIENAIQILKEVLEKNNFNFYFSIDNKLYRKNSHGVKRLKDMKELLNEYEEYICSSEQT